MRPQDKAIGWARPKGCKNPTLYGLAVNKRMEDHEVWREFGQKFPAKEGDGGGGGKGKKMKMKLEEGKVFWFALFERV